MKTKLLSIILMATMGLSLSCKKKSDESAETVLDKNLIKNAQKFTDLLGGRSNDQGTFTIQHIERNADMMTITVKGGCKEEDFQIVWDGLVMLSHPAQVRLVLHNTSATTCEMQNEYNIKVNLRKIIGEHDPKDFIFHVANGSVKQDKSLNPNGSVSSN